MKRTKEGSTLWFTGLHGSGKSTIARGIAEILSKQKIPFVLFDGDEIRKIISSDLGFSTDDRNKHLKRVADISKLISKGNILTIVSVASPTEQSREYVKKIFKNVLVVYVKCSVEECKRRDSKGHYKKAMEKEKGFENFVGVNLPFEEPKNPDIVLETDKESVEESVNKIVGILEAKLRLHNLIQI